MSFGSESLRLSSDVTEKGRPWSVSDDVNDTSTSLIQNLLSPGPKVPSRLMLENVESPRGGSRNQKGGGGGGGVLFPENHTYSPTFNGWGAHFLAICRDCTALED